MCGCGCGCGCGGGVCVKLVSSSESSTACPLPPALPHHKKQCWHNRGPKSHRPAGLAQVMRPRWRLPMGNAWRVSKAALAFQHEPRMHQEAPRSWMGGARGRISSQTGSTESVFAYVLALHSELEFPSPKLEGAQENEKVTKRAPGNRFSLTFWRCTRSSNSRPQNWRGAQECEKVAKRVPGCRFSRTSWRYTRSSNSRPKNWRGRKSAKK